MTENYRQLGKRYEDIANRIVQAVGPLNQKVLLISEAERACVEATIFIEQENDITYQDAGDELAYAILDAWEAEKADAKWSMLEMEIVGRQFSAEFYDEDEMPEGNLTFERQDVILRKHFGDKPVRDNPDLGGIDIQDSQTV